MELLVQRKDCRVCKGTQLEKAISLAAQPPANSFLKKEEINGKEHKFPLDVYFCKSCGFSQLIDIVSPDLLFKNYVYVSSTSPVFIAHFKELAQKLIERFILAKNSLVVDIGSNDGIFLRPFKESGMKILGIDPAQNIAKIANESGIETLPNYFTPELAAKIAKERGKAKIITTTSVFSHVDGLDEFVQGVQELLSDDGVFIIEVYYLKTLIEKNLFDTIYHEHLSYFTAKTMKKLLERLGMDVFDFEKTDTHGGSLRVFAQKQNGSHKHSRNVDKFIAEEDKRKLHDINTLKELSIKIEENKAALIGLLLDLKSKGKKIAGYGAPAKGNTLLNHFGIGTQFLEYIVDDSKWKQNTYSPGMHIPVVASSMLNENKPDYVFILAWNFSDSIIKKLPNFDKFIIPVPTPKIVSGVVELDLVEVCDTILLESRKLEGKTVLVTGGSGFIGSYIIAVIDKLNEKYFTYPCNVISLDNHLVGKKNNLLKEIKSEHIKYLVHDVSKPFETDDDVDYIISAAGVASPVYYKKFPIETIDGTVFGLKNMLSLAKLKNSKSLLFFSSSEIYGDPDPNFIPTPETYKGNVSSTGPRSCYDESKRIGETICMAYFRVHNSPVKMVRPFNVFGPGMKGADYRVVPNFMNQGMHGKNLTVHDHGNQTRTFCYATDAVSGFFKILLSEDNGEVFNVGNSDNEINMRSLADMMANEIFNGKIKVELVKYPDNYPQDEPRRRCPDLSKIKSKVGYSPNIGISEGLKRFHKWFLNNAMDSSV